MEPNHEDRWVAERLAMLEPEWQPDFAHGRALLDEGLAKRRGARRWMVAAAAAAALCVAAVALPQTRAFAQQLWYRVVLHRIDVVRLDLSDLPLHAEINMKGPSEAARDLDDAERKAGFRPYLPADGVVTGAAALTIVPRLDVAQTIHVREVEAALRKVGAGDVQVPAEWEGVQLRTEIGPMVAADYPDDVQVLQARPIELSIPPGFPLERFAEVAFRSLGVSVWEARALAQKFVRNPGWLLDVPPDEVVNIQEVPLRSGTALVIEDFDDQGKLERVTVIRSTSQRIYTVSTKNRELGIRIAGALP
ncbi:MAG TPA: hypothetical protein VGF49_14200 [Candidatus Solibacter sp.]|jgi:hypothetical protein